MSCKNQCEWTECPSNISEGSGVDIHWILVRVKISVSGVDVLWILMRVKIEWSRRLSKIEWSIRLSNISENKNLDSTL